MRNKTEQKSREYAEMITAQPEPFAFTYTTPLLPGWHRLAALIARHQIARAVRKAGEDVTDSGALPGRRLEVDLTWYTPDGSDRGQLAPTLRAARTALTAAGIDITHAHVTARAYATTTALRPGTPSRSFPALVEALTPRVVIDISEHD